MEPIAPRFVSQPLEGIDHIDGQPRFFCKLLHFSVNGVTVVRPGIIKNVFPLDHSFRRSLLPLLR